ncbi:DUF7405 family protein [Natrarchaeobius oligotrophus]|uniref:Tat pathway signal protein n=1 Tax=Natrarchaeobius chitinivorans TaxID=1679083 RepID=A0A3N6M4H4_NATCH|nr:Tat pathway signal protein [Natrarchaeobius chitinivorans]RQG98423.1 Tat pathway signal protein [Natrarchaeobius chitinivorans]
MTLPDRSSLSRREYARALVAAGGVAALSACLGVDGNDGERDVPPGTSDPDALPERQHAWNEALETDADGNVRLPEHHVLVPLSLRDDPDEVASETTEDALRTLERAYEWSNDGLVFTVGYAPAYFDRFDESMPPSVDLPDPEALTDRESPEFDEFDAVIHLASDRPDVVLEAEEGLFGERETLNGVDVEATLADVFERIDDRRRTGFVGPGLPAERTDVSGVPESIPEEAPFFMGFRSGFRESQATEDRVTIDEGPFAGGTTQHVSSMDLQLEVWFEQDNHYQRVSKMFSPEHAEDDLVGEHGERLGATSGLTDERIEATSADARERGVVGHAQKAARAREDGDPLLLRRDFNTVDGDRPGLHFLSLQRGIDEFVRVREAMTGADLDVPFANNGIRHYIFVNRRGNFLIPPRPLRSLPSPDPDPT